MNDSPPALLRGKEWRCPRHLLRSSRLPHLRVACVRAALSPLWTISGPAGTQGAPRSRERLDAPAYDSARETAQQNHRGAAQNSCCGRSERSVGTGLAESSHCNPQIAQSTSRWFSARGREASAGSDRGSPSHPREEREARSQRCHGYTLRTNA